MPTKVIMGTEGDEGFDLEVPVSGTPYMDGPLFGGDDDEYIAGLGGHDYLGGGDGQDELHGDAGNDWMSGGSGNDTMYGGTGNDSMMGDDTVYYNGWDTMWGGAGNDTMRGNMGNDELHGGSDADVLNGDEGDDRVYGDSGSDVVAGGDGNDWLYGGTENDTLIGGAGNDVLNGDSGADMMDGGDGNDTYHLDNAGDRITGDASGFDTVNTSVGIDLTAWGAGASGIEKVTVTTASAVKIVGNVANNELIGNIGNDTLIGGAGHDTLNGGAGADSLAGGTGADTYVVDNINDVVNETGGDGAIDTVHLISTKFSLINPNQAIGKIENVIYKSSGSFNVAITGNDLNNLLDASKSLSSDLKGGFGDDTLVGGIGQDTLDGGNGNDVLRGGAGSDTYVVDSANDKVVEAVGGGIDTVMTWGNYTLSANVENLQVLGQQGVIVSGNALGNVMIGHDGNDDLYGNGGNDSLVGGLGNDWLSGGTGADTMEGGAGDDVYYIDALSDQVVGEAAASGIDEIRTYLSSYALGEALENLQALTGQNFTGFGNELGNVIHGNSGADALYGLNGNDVLNGYSGSDTLMGGLGDDTLKGGTGADSMHGGDGFDVISYAGSTTGVAIYIDKQSVAGGEASGDQIAGIEGAIGSEGNDFYYGATFDDSFQGGAGEDVFNGSAGADRFDGGAGSDTAVYTNSAAGVKVNLALGLAVGGDAQGDVLTGVENLVGSAFDDTLGGDAGANRLMGGGGRDKLNGGGGNDELIGGAGNDALVGGEGQDTLRGDAGVDQLRGGAGDDVLWGGGDRDHFFLEHGTGTDRVADFTDGQDLIRAAGVTYADLAIAASADGAVVSFAGSTDSLLLLGIDAALLSQADFLFT
ncbi:calcium-binding protein [Muricoccus radiodurans]|uniref:calcium-binding protein n=1 Tax=Muricoccus radiodurans TaxID=2231721 RepID=UPI003CF892AE